MKIITQQNTCIAILLSLLMVFSGCNSSNNETSTGGGTTVATPSTSDDSGSTVNTAPSSSLAGTYTGTATATASALGLTESETVPVTIIIDQNGRMTVQSESDIFPDVITLTGNAFGYSQTFNNEDFGSVKCSGTLSLQGSINNNGLLTANLNSQSATCNSNGIDIPGTVSGTLTATKQG